MTDRPGYEFWDYTHKETAQQFRVFKDTRRVLEVYEDHLNKLIRGLILSEIASGKKPKDKIEFKVKDGDSEATVKMKPQKGKEDALCKEVRIEYPDRTGVLLAFNDEGKIKSMEFDEVFKDQPTRTPAIVNLLQLGNPNVGIGQDKTSISQVKIIKFGVEKPDELSLYAYASYGEGRQWRYNVERSGAFWAGKLPFSNVVKSTLDTFMPSEMRQAIPA